jgi:indolepyruvate ferredoxin oxidoreductase alpha subunit
MRVSHAREIIQMDKDTNFTKTNNRFKRDIGRWAAVPRVGRLTQGYEQLDRIDKIATYNWENLLEPEFNKCKSKGLLILTSGTGYGFVKETLSDIGLEADIVKVAMPYPLPVEKMKKEFERYDKVIVFEEPYPCVEEQIACKKVYGKNTKTVHNIDEMSKERVLKALQNIGFYNENNIYEAPKIDFGFEVPARPPALCPGCPHRDIFYSIMKVFKKNKSIYPSDIGCYTLALSQGAIDTVLCMGGSISMASGLSIANPDKTIIATIGDGTFFHSGIPPLLNAAYQGHKFILVVLDNSTIAMTGRQATPERFNQSINITKIVEGMGIECFEHTYSYEMHENINFFKKIKEIYKDAIGPTVVVVKQFCILDRPRADDWVPNVYAKVNEEKCVACDQCTTVYKCPPMHYNEHGKIEIDPFLCAGCAGCLEVICPTDAFEIDKKEILG